MIKKIFSALIFISTSLMVVLIFINAVLRYVANSGITQSEELSRYFFIWMCFLGAVAVFAEGNHVSVDLLTKRLSGLPKKVVAILVDIMILVISGIVFYGGSLYVLSVSQARTPACKLPQPVVSSAILVCMGGIIVLGIKKLYKDLRADFGRDGTKGKEE